MLLVSLSLLNVEKIASQIEVGAYTGDWFYCLHYFLALTAYIDYTALNPKSHLYYSVISFVQLSEHFDKPLGHMVTTLLTTGGAYLCPVRRKWPFLS